jgi:ABC-type uncharacterized transport system fused permease/ATPase subunit
MQIGAAFGQVQLSLNGFVETFPRIAERRNAVARGVVFRDVIGELDALIADASQLTLAITEWVPDRLAGQLDKEERWDRILSLGEQQRLAFVRLLLHRPRWMRRTRTGIGRGGRRSIPARCRCCGRRAARD